MNNMQRLMVINKVARGLKEELEDINSSQQMMLDKAWVIGMLSDHTLSEDELSKEVEQVKKTHPEFTDLLRVLKKGDKYIFTDVLGRKQVFIYDGVRREVKGCEFEFFVDDKGGGCFFTDAEVDKMEKVIVDDEKDWQVDVMIEMAKDSDKLESENFLEKVNNILCPKPLDPPTTTAEAVARQTREHRFYAWLLKHLILPKCLRMRLIKKVSDTAQY